MAEVRQEGEARGTSLLAHIVHTPERVSNLFKNPIGLEMGSHDPAFRTLYVLSHGFLVHILV